MTFASTLVERWRSLLTPSALPGWPPRMPTRGFWVRHLQRSVVSVVNALVTVVDRGGCESFIVRRRSGVVGCSEIVVLNF